MHTVDEQSQQALIRLKESILNATPSRRIRDLLNYLEQYHRPPSCTTAISRCFSCRRHRMVGHHLRNAYQTMEYVERRQIYVRVLHGCENILNKQIPLPASNTSLDPLLPKEAIEASLRDSLRGDWRKVTVEIDYESLSIHHAGVTLALQDYLLTSRQDHFIRRVALLPLKDKVPQLEIDCHPQIFQRLEEAANRGTRGWLMEMMQGTKQEAVDSDNEEEAQSDRPSIGDKLSQRVILAADQLISLNNPHISDYLSCRHPLSPTREDPKRLIPSGEWHYFFEGEYAQGKDGELVVSNQAKLQAQSSVIKYILKRLLSGSKVTSISLPVTVFGTDSNLSLLMGSFRHAPLILAGAAELSAVQRFKRVIKFALSCPPCYIRCDKPFNPILGETYQRRVAGALFYGQQVSHHPPISSVLIRASDFTLYGSFQAEVEFGFNSAVGNNRGWTRISFHPEDHSKQVVRFTNSPGEMGGLIFGKRTLKLTGSVYFIDEENGLFCEMFFGRVKWQPGVGAKQDSIQGRILKLKAGRDMSRPQAINESDVEDYIGLVRGQWLSKVYFNEELLLDSLKEYPPVIEDYQGLLPSDYSLRQDLMLKISGETEKCQTAKQALEEAQRRDRKLREAKGKSNT